jgi:hypothetical protein
MSQKNRKVEINSYLRGKMHKDCNQEAIYQCEYKDGDVKITEFENCGKKKCYGLTCLKTDSEIMCYCYKHSYK